MFMYILSMYIEVHYMLFPIVTYTDALYMYNNYTASFNPVKPYFSLLGSYPTKSTAVQCLHFTRKNLLIAAGPYSK